MGVDGISSGVVSAAMQMKNLQVSSEIETSVMKKVMDQAQETINSCWRHYQNKMV